MSDESRKVARLIKFGLGIALGLVTEIVHVVRPSWARAGTIAFTKKLAGYLLIYDTKRIEDAAVVVPALTVALFSWAILSVPELWDLLKKTPSAHLCQVPKRPLRAHPHSSCVGPAVGHEPEPQ